MIKLNPCDKELVYQTYLGRNLKELDNRELNGFIDKMTF